MLTFENPNGITRIVFHYPGIKLPTTLAEATFWFHNRSNYTLNSWVYSTNHKRISINYFNFVLIAGTAGMSLASVIRGEFAYPGVGILAGDSIQYLTIATAHGVIMVFFMIMPSIFGAFGNFLLPTQLGVHDVAFPRLNSAAFWFLPGGLVMLFQLVCVDRRYQRLNCFNMRQLDTVLRRQFFTDFFSTGDHKQLMGDTLLGLRFKLNQLENTHPDSYSFFNYGTTSNTSTKYTPLYIDRLYDFVRLPVLTKYTFNLEFVYNFLREVNFPSLTLLNLYNSLNYSVANLLLPATLTNTGLLTTISKTITLNQNLPINVTTAQNLKPQVTLEVEETTFSLKSTNTITQATNLSLLTDSDTSGRFPRFTNPMVEYEYRKGTYFTVWADRFPSLMTSLIELGRNDYFAKWFKNGPFLKLFNNDLNLYLKNLSNTHSNQTYKSLPDSWFSSHVQPTNNLVNIINLMSALPAYNQAVLWGPQSFSKKWKKNKNITVEQLGFGLSQPLLVDDFINLGPRVLYFPNFFRSGDSDFALFKKSFFIKLQENEKIYVSRPWVTPTVTLPKTNRRIMKVITSSEEDTKQLLLTKPYAYQFRWSSNPILKQKYYRLFTTDSTQQRIVANWRELKFSREAWRCKLLVARHQTSLFRRFSDEDALFWSVERNAKDLLPGWAMITPFSSRLRYTAVGRTDIGLMGVLLVLNASIISSANFLITYRYLSTLNNRKMRDARSFFTEGLITASWMMVAANPMLVIGIIMLLSDRHWQTSFFDYSGGGDAVLFQHMFWFFGHPEVYVIMLPIFGYVNTILSFYLRKRISARGSLLYSMYTIAFLGFFVWGHHMYMVGLSHTTRMLFSTLTVMISVPAATKLMHWSVTVVNSFFTLELPLLFTLTFIFFFVSGGVSGMYVANTGMDVLFHDTFYVIGHFHVMFAGSGMIGIFAAFYFYFPALYGVRYSRVYGYIHYVYYIIGQLMTVIPMLWLGYCGQPRRVLDYPSAFGGWHSVSSAGHLLSVAAMLSFFMMIYDSIRQSKPAVRNTFGVGRFNTRLNFYFFEIYRLRFTQQKNFMHTRVPSYQSVGKSGVKYGGRVYTQDLVDINLLTLKSFEVSTLSYRYVTPSSTRSTTTSVK